jgi:predicted O-methyltransferase YrrM
MANMDETTWTRVDRYLSDALVNADPPLEAALAASAEAGLPQIEVTRNQGKFLHLLARLHGAAAILEMGTLGGYSTIWLARALPAGGRLVTLEASPDYAEVARANLVRAQVAERVEVIVGPALETLPELTGPFDLVFIDADKASTPEYLEWTLRLTRPGSLVVVDNVVRNGAVADADSRDPSIRGMRRAIDLLAREPTLDATAIQTVGAKGYDGFAIALVTEPRDC